MITERNTQHAAPDVHRGDSHVATSENRFAEQPPHKFIPFPTYDGIYPTAYGSQPSQGPAWQRARELLTWATEVGQQAEVDLHQLRMLTQWRKHSPFVSRLSEMAADRRDHEAHVPLYLPPVQSLERACIGFRDAIAALRAATAASRESDAIKLTNTAVPKLRSATGTWNDAHERINDYQSRTGQGNAAVQEFVKTAFLAIVAATTGFTVGGAVGIGSGTLRSLVATTGATSAATGAADGVLTAAEQLHAGTLDPATIARSAVGQTARTFAIGMVGGALTRAFAGALKLAMHSSAQSKGMHRFMAMYRATRLADHDVLVGSVIAALAAGGAGAVIAGVEAVLQEHHGHALSETELCKLVVEQLVISGAYQLAVAAAMRRTNSNFVDLRGKPIDELLEGKHLPPNSHWGLYEVKGPTQTVRLLTTPRDLSYNSAMHDASGVDPQLRSIQAALANPDKANGYLNNSLVIHTHGDTRALVPGNKNVANLADRVLGKVPCDTIHLSACAQADAVGPKQKSNALGFQEEVHNLLAARNYSGTMPEVYTASKPGVTRPGDYVNDTPRLATKPGFVAQDQPIDWVKFEQERLNAIATLKWLAAGGAVVGATINRNELLNLTLDVLGVDRADELGDQEISAGGETLQR